MFPQFDFLSHFSHSNSRMKQQTAPSRQTKAQYRQQELKREMARAKRDRRKAAKKANLGNQFKRGK